MLQKSAEQLVSFQFDEVVLAGFGIAVGPAHFAVGQEMDGAIDGGRFKDVTGEIMQDVFSRTGRLTVHHPRLFPNFGRDLLQQLGMFFENGLLEEGAEMSAQRFDMEKVVVLRGNPGTSVETEFISGKQEMDMADRS